MGSCHRKNETKHAKNMKNKHLSEHPDKMRFLHKYQFFHFFSTHLTIEIIVFLILFSVFWQFLSLRLYVISIFKLLNNNVIIHTIKVNKNAEKNGKNWICLKIWVIRWHVFYGFLLFRSHIIPYKCKMTSFSQKM